MNETEEQAAFKGRDAQRLLDDPLLKEAFKVVADSLETAGLKCGRTDAETALALWNCKQLLVGVQREIYRFIETGKIAEDIIERRKKPLMQRVFSR